MRKSILFLLAFILFVKSVEGQSCTRYLLLRSQSDVDNVTETDKSCQITGVLISGLDITNLDALSGITEIDGVLHIQNNPLLENLSGLSQLVTVNGEIDINNNGSLTTLEGLNALTTVGSNVRVADNPTLTSLTALSKLTLVPGFLSVGRNSTLQSLAGLEGITSVQGAIAIGANTHLPDLEGLNGLTFVGDFLYIGENPVLGSIGALSKLKTVLGYINLESNSSLTNLTGLDNIEYSGIQYIKIISSRQLSVCGVAGICRFLSYRSDYLISNNAVGCNTRSQIVNSELCLIALPVNLVSFTGTSGTESNLLQWTTSSEISNYGFEVEKSQNAHNFVLAGFVNGSGTTKTNQSYSFTDYSESPVTYYRLKQLDFDGTSSYSKIIAVKKPKSQLTKEQISFFPNPATGWLNIETSNRDQPYCLQTSNGIVVSEGSSIPAKPLNTSRLQNGLYIISVGKESFKIIVQN